MSAILMKFRNGENVKRGKDKGGNDAVAVPYAVMGTTGV